MSKDIYTELKLPLESIYNLDAIKDTKLPQRIIKSLQEVKPKNILIVNEKPIILFFKYEDEEQKKWIFKKCWNFSEAPIVIIENDSDFEVYNGFNFFTDSKELELLNKDGLNYISILNGDYFKFLNETKSAKQNKKVDTYLLENIKNAREILVSLLEKDSHKDSKYLKHIANSLIGRIIFIRYLIDRKVSLKKYKNTLTHNDDLKVILADKNKTYELFKYLKSNDGFNGDWFPILDDEENIVQEKHLKVLEELISGSELKVGQRNIQRSLFDIYDFSIIPIEFISNVYESFIGEDEQKKSGAYYTPTFLVDYILKYTVDEYFKNNPNTYNCKVLDPACGSGIFLVEALRKLVAQFEKIKQRPIEAKELKKLVQDNIFGIDKDENAISISVFSLYLTMLDYQNPKELDEFKFPYLLKSKDNPTPNFFNNDFFDIEAEYNNILKEKKLNFIIGNPPYGRGIAKESKFISGYLKSSEINISGQDIVQPFIVRVSDLSNKNTKISFIVTSKVLYNLQTKSFRINHFFNKFKVTHILELSSVMEEVFENAKVPVSILFYEKAIKKDILSNVIKYVSIKPSPYFKKLKMLIISKSDFKKVLQSKVLDYDYIWKILIYGSYLDFNFIKRLKDSKTIKDHILSDNIGITVGNKNTPVKNEYLKMSYIQTKQFKPFYIELNNIKWSELYVERNRSIDIFKAPSLLISKGITKKLEVKSAILKEDAIFTGTITTVKTKSMETLYSILGYLNSSFFKYYMMHTASSIGTERPQLHNPEKFSLPFIEDNEVTKYVKELEEISSKDFFKDENRFNIVKEKLDNIILNCFNLNEQENVLINYVNELIIPWVVEKKYDIAYKKLGFKDDVLIAYINIFMEHYTKIYNQNNMYFQANILWDKYAIGIYFKVLKEKPEDNITWKKESNIQKFIKLSGSQTLENLFIQKDIKGFEKDGFYVVKPNEYKNWHKAIGYLDFYEFKEAILRAGKVGK